MHMILYVHTILHLCFIYISCHINHIRAKQLLSSVGTRSTACWVAGRIVQSWGRCYRTGHLALRSLSHEVLADDMDVHPPALAK